MHIHLLRGRLLSEQIALFERLASQLAVNEAELAVLELDRLVVLLDHTPGFVAPELQRLYFLVEACERVDLYPRIAAGENLSEGILQGFAVDNV